MSDDYESTHICIRFIRSETGRVYNMTVETLAMQLFRDAYPEIDFPAVRWRDQSHEMRQLFRKIAEGDEPLSATAPHQPTPKLLR